MRNSLNNMVLVIGGISSGKSEFAEQLLAELHGNANADSGFFYFTPAAPPQDEEMTEKVAAHRLRRPDWLETVECGMTPVDYSGVPKENDALLFDSAGTLAGRMMMENPKATAEELVSGLEKRLVGFCTNVCRAGVSTVVVTEEVGMTLVAASEAGRKFQKIMGKLNQLLAAKAGRVYFVTAGIPSRLK